MSRIAGTLRRWVRGGAEKDVARSDLLVAAVGARAGWAAELADDRLTV